MKGRHSCRVNELVGEEEDTKVLYDQLENPKETLTSMQEENNPLEATLEEQPQQLQQLSNTGNLSGSTAYSMLKMHMGRMKGCSW